MSARRLDAEPQPTITEENFNGGQENGREMGALSNLRQQDGDQGLPGHSLSQVPTILSKVQTRNKD